MIQRFVAVLILSFLTSSTAWSLDAVDRISPSKLKSLHAAIEQLKSERQAIPRTGPFKEYRANLHVHSAFSHDSRGKIDDIVRSAKAAGTSILMFNEHPANHYDIFENGHQGLYEDVLLIPGAEFKGLLVFPRTSIKAVESSKPQELSDFVRGRDGLTFLSHLEERMDWNIQGLTGVEIYNTHADAKDEKRLFSSIKNPLWLLKTADLIREYPQESFSSLHDYPENYLRRWDELCLQAPLTGISANDSHQNIGMVVRFAEDGKVAVEDALGENTPTPEPAALSPTNPIPKDAKVGDSLFELRLDRYEFSLRHVGTHLLSTELSQPAVWQALSQGRAFVAFDWICDSTGFDFAAVQGSQRYEMGSSPQYHPEMKLTGHAPLPGEWRLIRNGHRIETISGRDLDFSLREPGNYRVELWLNVADESRIWILSNPIYVAAQ